VSPSYQCGRGQVRWCRVRVRLRRGSPGGDLSPRKTRTCKPANGSAPILVDETTSLLSFQVPPPSGTGRAAQGRAGPAVSLVQPALYEAQGHWQAIGRTQYAQIPGPGRCLNSKAASSQSQDSQNIPIGNHRSYSGARYTFHPCCCHVPYCNPPSLWQESTDHGVRSRTHR
jgi:hypothetical protein